MNKYMTTAHITGPYCTGAVAWAGARPVLVFPQRLRRGDDLVFGDLHLDRRDVENLTAGTVHLSSARQVRSAAAAAGRFVPDHHIRVGHLRKSLAAVPVLPAGFAFRRFTQRPGSEFAGAVRGRWFRRVLRVATQLRFQIGDSGPERPILRLQFCDSRFVHFPHRIHLDLQGTDHRDEFRDSELFHSAMIPPP